jgi:hypothetical protein
MNSKLLSKIIGQKIVNIEYVDMGNGNAPMITLENGIELMALQDPEGNGPGFITVDKDSNSLGGF